MKKILLLSVSILIVSKICFAQLIEDKLTKWSKENIIEKLYLQLDRESYYAGQTIWFKGYFMSNLLPSAKSSSVYVELVNNQSEVLLKEVFPAYLSATIGQLDIPGNIASGTYQIRAYSRQMMNQPDYIFYKRISIFGKETHRKETTKANKKINLLYFAEGGNFISNVLNVVAFKTTDQNGMPINIEGEIKTENGELVTSFKSSHDGLGSFSIIPIKSDSYYAVINGSSEKYSLPQQSENGIAFSVRNSIKGKQFRIQYAGELEAFKPAYMIGQMGNEFLFKQPFAKDKKQINGIIPTSGLYSGILHLTVFNKDNMPLAERITFIDNKEYIVPAEIKLDTLDTSPRKRNHFSIAMKDTIIGNFSVSVTDADYASEAIRPQNIYSWFLLSSDLKGYIHNPAYYFSASTEEVKNSLDLVMMTNGWTRFRWTDLAQDKLPAPQFKDLGYITLKGSISIEGTKKPLDNKDVIVMMRHADTTLGKNGATRIIKTDSLGRFEMDSIIFYDKMKILFSDVRGKKSKFITVKLEGDSLYKKYNIQSLSIPYDSTTTNIAAKMTDAYTDNTKAAGLMLENVNVKARKKSETEKLDDTYTSSLFSGGVNSRTFDLRNENFSGDLFQYLQGRVPGLTVSGYPGNYELHYRDAGFGGGNVSLFLDEVHTDATMIESIPVNQIAMVKLMPHSIASQGGGTALAIYMKKGAELNASLESPTDIITYKGYTIIKEFYNPDYDKQPSNDKADNRLTISWQPAIFVSDVNATLPVIFYNNDRTKRFKIVAEGITSDGRMLMIEKIIEPSGNF